MVGLKEFVLHNTLGPDDVHFHFSGVSDHIHILLGLTKDFLASKRPQNC